MLAGLCQSIHLGSTTWNESNQQQKPTVVCNQQPLHGLKQTVNQINNTHIGKWPDPAQHHHKSNILSFTINQFSPTVHSPGAKPGFFCTVLGPAGNGRSIARKGCVSRTLAPVIVFRQTSQSGLLLGGVNPKESDNSNDCYLPA